MKTLLLLLPACSDFALKGKDDGPSDFDESPAPRIAVDPTSIAFDALGVYGLVSLH